MANPCASILARAEVYSDRTLPTADGSGSIPGKSFRLQLLLLGSLLANCRADGWGMSEYTRVASDVPGLPSF
jgi:hypothetical protein